MIKRYQYKANTQTLLVPVSVDQWIGQFPTILFKKPTLSDAIKAGYVDFVDYQPFYIESITLDKWSPNLPDIRFNRRVLSDAIQAGSFSFIRPLITPDKWKVSYDDIITVRRRTLSYAIVAGSNFLPPMQPPEAPAMTRDYLGYRGRTRTWIKQVSKGIVLGE
jgi:hypothetical protein